jgi:hypothetical protein
MLRKMFGHMGAVLLLGAVALGCSGTKGPGFAGSGSSANGNPNGPGAGGSGAAPGVPVVGGSGASNNGPLGVMGMGGSTMAASGAAAPKASCPGGGSTTISGTVYDPAMQNPLYNITVYVPQSPTLPALPSGASCNTCASLYPEIVASAVTDATGHFTIDNAPSGTNIPLVVQTGKWRKQYTLASVASCKDNPQPDKSLRLPKNQIHGDGNLPDIAISTGEADSLECLLLRMGVDTDEYVGGGGGPGHLHIFTGSLGASTMPASPESYLSLWDSTAHMLKNDVVLLSCEGIDTAPLTVQNQQSLVDYTAAGGRVFASHFHYAWFNTGPFAAANLAMWCPGAHGGSIPGVIPTCSGFSLVADTLSLPGNVVTTLKGGMPFPEGVALKQWLGVVGALTKGQLPIWYARHDADVTAANQPPSQPWIELDKTTPAPHATMYFSFDTPIGITPACGRVVYSDLHVSGGAVNAPEPGVPPDYPVSVDYIVPSGCAMHALTPQEKALEFMIFDLSSCLVPIGEVPIAPPPRPPR